MNTVTTQSHEEKNYLLDEIEDDLNQPLISQHIFSRFNQEPTYRDSLRSFLLYGICFPSFTIALFLVKIVPLAFFMFKPYEYTYLFGLLVLSSLYGYSVIVPAIQEDSDIVNTFISEVSAIQQSPHKNDVEVARKALESLASLGFDTAELYIQLLKEPHIWAAVKEERQRRKTQKKVFAGLLLMGVLLIEILIFFIPHMNRRSETEEQASIFVLGMVIALTFSALVLDVRRALAKEREVDRLAKALLLRASSYVTV